MYLELLCEEKSSGHADPFDQAQRKFVVAEMAGGMIV